MKNDVFELVGQENGSTSIVLAGVHGNEGCGIEALEQLTSSLHIESGRVLFLIGNPRAVEQNVRFTEANLNRMFKPDTLLSVAEKSSYEYTRAQFLKKYLDEADALLDVHASRTPESRTFVICEENGLPISKYLPVDLVVSGIDAIQPGGTDYYMNAHGKVGVCVECGYLGDPESTNVAKESILAFLATRGHITRDTSARKQSHLQVFYMYVTKFSLFSLTKPFKDFENITREQPIGRDGTEEVRAPHDCVILFPGSRGKAGDEAFLLGTYKTT